MPHTHHELVQSAKQAMQKGDHRQAETLLYRMIEQKTPFADVYSLMGMIQYHAGRFGKAIDFFEKALAINPHYAEALLYLSVLYHDLGYYEKGKKRERHLFSLPKLSGSLAVASPFRARLANMHAEIGDLYRGLGCALEAQLEYERALALEPSYLDIRLKRALCLRVANAASPEVIKELKAIVKENPAYLQAQLELGTSYYLAKQWKEAKATWQALVKRDPGHKNAAVYLKLLDRKEKEIKAKGHQAVAPRQKSEHPKKNKQHSPKRPDKKTSQKTKKGKHK